MRATALMISSHHGGADSLLTGAGLSACLAPPSWAEIDFWQLEMIESQANRFEPSALAVKSSFTEVVPRPVSATSASSVMNLCTLSLRV